MQFAIGKKKELATEGYILAFMELKAGDIILERQYNFVSNTISKYTNSHYSHAMIYDGNTIMEATRDGGVFSKVPNRFFVENECDLKILRFKGSLPQYVIERIVSYAGEVVGAAYSVPEAMKTADLSQIKSGNKKIKQLKPGDLKILQKNSKQQFCSRLVAQCYERANIQLVDNIRYCSPGDIERSLLLEEIKGLVFKASPQELLHAQSGNCHPKHVVNTVKWVKNAKKILKKSGREAETINEIYQEVIRLGNHKVDKLIRNEMIASGYTTDYKDDEHENPYRYKVSLFEEKIIAGEIDYDTEIDKEIKIHKKYSINYETLIDYHSKYPLNILECEIELYKNLLLTIKRRLLVIQECHSRIPNHSSLIQDAMRISNEISALGI